MMTPFEKELLKRLDRHTELLELLVMAQAPRKVMLGAPDPDETEEQRQARFADLDNGIVLAQKLGAQPGYFASPEWQQHLAAAGFESAPTTRSTRVTGHPETPEERRARFAARAAEVGMPAEEAEAAYGRVQTNLDTLQEETPPSAPPKKTAAAKKPGK